MTIPRLTPDDPRLTHINAVDYRHALMLWSALEHLRPAHVLEIGCFQGVTTDVFLSALKAGFIDRLTLCDKAPTAYIQALALHRGVELFDLDSTHKTIRDLRPDFTFLDGDHRATGLADVILQLQARTATIAIHDCFPDYVCPEWAWGSQMGAEQVIRQRSFCWDAKGRPQEWTQRGLLFGFFHFPHALTDILNQIAAAPHVGPDCSQSSRTSTP